MIFRAGIDYFQTDHIVRIHKIQERDATKEPTRYSIYLVGQTYGVDVAGDDLGPFEAWLTRELLKTDNAVKPTEYMKTDLSAPDPKTAKVDKKVA